MRDTVSRRRFVQWAGGVAAGLFLSPAPYALIDDLTIATQTRGRSTALPRGSRGRLATRCSACPHGCAMEVLTVGGRPYLGLPAARPAGGCALLPAVHQYALLPDRFRTTRLEGREVGDAAHGLRTAAAWIDDAVSRGAGIGMVDLSDRPAPITSLHALFEHVPSATWIDARHHPLDALGTVLGLDPGTELALDPALAARAVVVRPGCSTGPGRRVEDGDALSALARRLRAQDCSGVIFGEDGVGSRPPEALLHRVAALDQALDAIGPGRLLAPRPSLTLPGSRSLEEIPDASLELVVVDASRPAGAFAWRRLQKKLRPDTGRVITFALTPGPAARAASLVLPAQAPLEVEEIVGGSRRGAGTRLAISKPVHREPSPAGVDPLDLLRTLTAGGTPTSRTDRLAAFVRGTGRGHVETIDKTMLPVTATDDRDLVSALARGGTWIDAALDAVPRATIDEIHAVDAPGLVLEGGVVVASGERVPSILAKVATEQPLLARSSRLRLHPRTAQDFRVHDGDRLRVKTTVGALEARAVFDPTVRRGALVAGLGLGDGAVDPQHAATDREGLEELDFDPGADGVPGILDVEVM